jgi:sulfate-transporting ATPase
VLGLNGSGKSTLLRIMAGVDKDYIGETILNPGYTVGYLEQEPLLDETQAPCASRRRGRAGGGRRPAPIRRDQRPLRRRAGRRTRWTLIEDQGKLQDKLDHMDAWNLDSRLELAMDALRCPPGDTPVSCSPAASGGAWPWCRLLLKEPDILLLDEPTNHLDAESVAWLEKAPAASTPARSSPSPTTATSSTTWPAGFWSWTAATASPGGATTRPGWSRSSNGWPRKRSRRRCA